MSFTMTFFTKNTSWDTDTVPVICQDKYTCSIARDYPVFFYSVAYFESRKVILLEKCLKYILSLNDHCSPLIYIFALSAVGEVT